MGLYTQHYKSNVIS